MSDNPVTFELLTDWSKHADARIKYYSGTAVYRRAIELSEPAVSGPNYGARLAAPQNLSARHVTQGAWLTPCMPRTPPTTLPERFKNRGLLVLKKLDGLYAGKHAKERSPRKWNSPPFNGDWSSSLFISQDPVAIDAVGFDFLRTEWDDAPHRFGTNDYLVEAALANDPPSGTFYDPDHDGNATRLASLGVYEHWNNPTDKHYSRNIETGPGIELVKLTDYAPN